MDDIIVIGAGPSGLMAAIQASYMGASVTVLERNDKPLKKLYATGNGRCNFSNLYMDDRVYRGRDPEFALKVTDDFDRNDLLLFFHNLGMMTKHIGDYIYPYNEQARTVADVLLLECRRLGISIKCDEEVAAITCGNPFKVRTKDGYFEGRKLILAVGGKASPVHGSDGNLNKVIAGLGIDYIEQRPALVPLLFTDRKLARLAGVRIKCAVMLLIDERSVACEQGEIIFNKDNISGIPVMQLSRYATQALSDESNVSLSIDLFPDEDEAGLNKLIYNSFKGYRYAAGAMEMGTGSSYVRYERTCLEALSLLLNEKLALYCIDRAGLAGEAESVNAADKNLKKLTGLLKDLRVDIKGDAGWERAQVTAGGVNTGGLSDELEWVKIPGLYAVGELVDIDGTCGGYNLQWAFSSGAAAGRSAACRLDQSN